MTSHFVGPIVPSPKRCAPAKVGRPTRCPAERLWSSDRCCDEYALVLGPRADVAELRSPNGASSPCSRDARRAASDCMLLMRMRLRSDSVQRARETVRLKVRVGVVPSKAPRPREREKISVLPQQARLTSKSHPMASCATRTATGAPGRTAHRQARSRAAGIERPPTQPPRAITPPHLDHWRLEAPLSTRSKKHPRHAHARGTSQLHLPL